MLRNLGLSVGVNMSLPVKCQADALKLWARLCRKSVHVSLLSADALKLWAKLRRQVKKLLHLINTAPIQPKSSDQHFDRRPRSHQIPENRRPKGSRPGFGPKRPFRLISVLTF